MSTADDVASMIREGRPENEITSALKQRGMSDKEISSVLTQTRIKDAVSGYESPTEDVSPAPSSRQQSKSSVQEYGEMSPSLMSPEESPSQPQKQAASTEELEDTNDQSFSAAPEAYGDYSYQQQYSPQGIGSDLISEIADQIVTEKLSPLIAGIDKITDMRSSMESQLKYLDERLKRIEKIIDRLQLSLLQRVGEYVSNVEDIKKEMVETQKTFKSLVDRK